MAAVFNKPFLPGYRLVNGGQLNDLFNNGQNSVEDAIVAHAGGTKAAAYQLTAQLNTVATVATAADSLLLPPAVVGRSVTIINNGAAAAQVFGQGTDTISGVATGTGVSQPAGSAVTYVCTVLGAWQVMSGAGAAAGAALLSASQTFTGVNTFNSMFRIPVATVAATGSVQGDAAALTPGFTVVTGADATKGVLLGTAAAGRMYIIKNIDVANAILKVYPQGTDIINAIAGGSPISMAAKTSAIFIASSGSQWYTIPLVPS